MTQRAGFHPGRDAARIGTLHSADMMAARCSGLVAVCVMAAALLTARSSTSSKPAVCTDAANLKTSVQDLKNVNVRENGVSAVSDQLSKIEQQFNTLKTDAKGKYSTQIDAMSKALSGLSSSVSAAKSNVNGATLSAVATSAKSVVTTWSRPCRTRADGPGDSFLHLLHLHVRRLATCGDLTCCGGLLWRGLKPGARRDGQSLDTGAEGRFDDGREAG
jgi:hypothetical protein